MTKHTYKSKEIGGMVKKISFTLLILIITAVFVSSTITAAAALDETINISPIVQLDYKNMPDLTTDTTVKVDVLTTLDNSTKATLKELRENVTGVAYLVNISSSGVNLSDVVNITINLPVAKTWANAQKNICVLKQSNGFKEIVTTELLENETTDSTLTYKAQIQSISDVLAVVGVETLSPVVETEAPTSNQTQTPLNEAAEPTETDSVETTPATTNVGLVGAMLGVLALSRRFK